MALGAPTLWEFNASATANMVNGGGFNTANAGMLANLTTDANTANTNSPVVSSASYNFGAGDINNWLYIQSGPNWNSGFYQIASVASNKATLYAAIGEAVQFNSATNMYSPNTVAGCATVGTPTSGVFAIDYSQSTAAVINGVADFNAAGASTTLTSATAAFTPVMVGNIFHQTTTGTGGFGVVGWYEIATYVNATTVTLDRTPNSGTASVNTTGYVGGALSLNSTLDDDFFEIVVAGNRIFIKSGTYTLGEAVAIASTSATATSRIKMHGYVTRRGTTTNGSNRPTIACGANSITMAPNWYVENLIVTGTGSPLFSAGTAHTTYNCAFFNSSTTAARVAFATGAGGTTINNEFVSQNGTALNGAGFQAIVSGNYIHDSDIGFLGSTNALPFVCNVVAACKTAAISALTADFRSSIVNNTLYGAVATPVGVGFRSTGGTSFNTIILNNIIYGMATGISISTVKQDSIIEDFNDFFNNTTNRSNIDTGLRSIALDPQFTAATELTGATATTSGSVLTQSGGDFSAVTDNVDYLRLVSGTGKTAGIYLITSHTATTVTLNNAPGTNATADGVWVIPIGHNFGIGTNLKALSLPSTFPGSASTAYLDLGAVQRQETGSAVATTGGGFS